ncbi:MAG: hypothetical protein MJB12_17540 [Firmicutes bacterium]|nr:hypothetical protein [Bacillota bacterium]
MIYKIKVFLFSIATSIILIFPIIKFAMKAFYEKEINFGLIDFISIILVITLIVFSFFKLFKKYANIIFINTYDQYIIKEKILDGYINVIFFVLSIICVIVYFLILLFDESQYVMAYICITLVYLFYGSPQLIVGEKYICYGKYLLNYNLIKQYMVIDDKMIVLEKTNEERINIACNPSMTKKLSDILSDKNVYQNI